MKGLWYESKQKSSAWRLLGEKEGDLGIKMSLKKQTMILIEEKETFTEK